MVIIKNQIAQIFYCQTSRKSKLSMKLVKNKYKIEVYVFISAKLNLQNNIDACCSQIQKL